MILERNDYLKYNDLPTEHPEQYFTSLEDTEKVIASLYEKAMIQTNRLLDKNVVNRVCNRILSASFIDIYGIGLSDTIAKEMCFKLQSLGLPCSYQMVLILNILIICSSIKVTSRSLSLRPAIIT